MKVKQTEQNRLSIGKPLRQLHMQTRFCCFVFFELNNMLSYLQKSSMNLNLYPYAWSCFLDVIKSILILYVFSKHELSNTRESKII